MLTWISIAAAAIAFAVLGWNLFQRLRSDRMATFNEKRRAMSRIVGRGEFVDGNRHVDVALALTPSTLYYENADMQASLDLEWIREIEYDTELATGTAIEHGRVLRLRSGSQVFEFVIPNDSIAKWHLDLPPRSATGEEEAKLAIGGDQTR